MEEGEAGKGGWRDGLFMLIISLPLSTICFCVYVCVELHVIVVPLLAV